MTRIPNIMAISFAVLTSACGSAGPVPNLVIRDVSVVDVESGQVRADVAVAIHGNRITRVGSFRSSGAGDSTVVIDGGGGYVIPGLWDMHVHVLNPGGGHVDMLKLLVANGITGFRDTWGDLEVAAEARRAGAEGTLPVPRFIISGNLVDGPDPVWPTSLVADSPERGRALVDSLVDAGAAFIKVYSKLPPNVYDAIAERATERGIPFAGHVPRLVTTRHASSLGQRTIEHLTGVILGCSPTEAETQEEWAEWTRKQAQGETVESAQAITSRLRERALDTQDETLCNEQWASFIANGTWQVPTLVTLRGVRHMGDPTFQQDPRLEYMPPAIRAFWNPTNARYTNFMSEIEIRAMGRERELVGMMVKAGVPLLAGSDTPNPYAFPGFGLHDELSLLAESGLSPLDALRTATVRPAEFLGATDSLGTVTTGKLADLVLLEDNPLADIENVRSIRGVVLKGVYHDRQSLDTMLDEVKRSAAGQ